VLGDACKATFVLELYRPQRVGPAQFLLSEVVFIRVVISGLDGF